MVDCANYNLSIVDISLMIKRIQSYKIDTPGYFLFYNNADPNNLVAQIPGDIWENRDEHFVTKCHSKQITKYG